MSPAALWAGANALATGKNLTLVAGAVGFSQLALALRFALKLRREASAPSAAFFPSVAVLVACKNVPPGFEDNIRSLLAQQYDGRLHFVFVTPSADAPAHRILERLLVRSPLKTLLLASNAVPTRCSGKIADMLFALERIDPRTEVLAFADDDVKVRPDWLRELVAPLEDRANIASTVPAVFVSARTGLVLLIRMASLGVINAYTVTLPIVFGLSWAIRRDDFIAVGVPSLWSRTFADDFFLAAVFQRTGRRIAWPSRACAVCPQYYGPRTLLAQTLKDFQYTRISIPGEWLLRGLAIAGKIYLWFWSLRTGNLAPAMAIVGADLLTTFTVFHAYRRYLPDRFADLPEALRPVEIWTALASVFVPFMEFPFFLRSIVTRTIHWTGRTYRVRDLFDVEVVAR